jgi:hypothetical protein
MIHTPPTMLDRADVIGGPTYKVTIETPDRTYRTYVTINDQDGNPFEIFIRTDNPQLYEWVNAVTILATRLLRLGVPLGEIAAELQTIHSGATSMHFLPGGERCISMVARIGTVLERHVR